MTFQTVVPGSGAATQVNDNSDALAQAGLFGKKNPATTGLTWGYFGGQFAGTTIADGTVALTASATNYIVALISSGAVSVSTGTTNWTNALYLQIAQVVTGASTITSWQDWRPAFTGSGGGAGMTNPMTASGDVIVGGASGAPARLPAGTNGYVLTLASGSPVWAASSSGFANPMTTLGDLIAGGASGAGSRIAIGSSGYVLTVVSGVPAWAPSAGGGASWGTITGTLSGQTDLQAALDAKGAAGVPQNSQSTAYTLILADANKHILHPSADTTARTFTVPANSSVAFPIGTAITFVNQNAGGVITIAITTDTMRLAGAGTTGSRTLAANGVATALKITSTEWIISGTGLT